MHDSRYEVLERCNRWFCHELWASWLTNCGQVKSATYEPRLQPGFCAGMGRKRFSASLTSQSYWQLYAPKKLYSYKNSAHTLASKLSEPLGLSGPTREVFD